MSKKHKNLLGFLGIDKDTKWKEEWQDMPEYINDDKTPFRSILVHFNDQESVDRFAKLVDQNISNKTRFIYYPKIEIDAVSKLRWISSKKDNNES